MCLNEVQKVSKETFQGSYMIRSFCWLFSSFSDLLLLQAHVDFSLEQLCAAYVSDIDKKRSVCFHYYMYAWKPLKSGVQSLSGILSGRAFISHMSFMHETHGSALKIVNFLISVLAFYSWSKRANLVLSGLLCIKTCKHANFH